MQIYNIALDCVVDTKVDCWPQCKHIQGKCGFCGENKMCCTVKSGWTDTSNGCDGICGGRTMHECIKNPNKGEINHFRFLETHTR